MSKLIVYTDSAGGHRWKLVARNGRIIADSSEAYSSRSKARAAAITLRLHVDRAKLVETT